MPTGDGWNEMPLGPGPSENDNERAEDEANNETGLNQPPKGIHRRAPFNLKAYKTGQSIFPHLVNLCILLQMAIVFITFSNLICQGLLFM